MNDYDDLDLGYYDYVDPWAYEEPEPDAVLIQSLSGPNTTVAQVSYGRVTASGDAKRNKGERTQKNVGLDLAVGRALVELRNQLIDRAYEALPGGAE
jgi:hypothetical protein